jgi:hypothetical protein
MKNEQKNLGADFPERTIAQFIIASERVLPLLRELAGETVNGKPTRRAAHAIRAMDLLEKAFLMATVKPEEVDGQPVDVERFTRSTL